MDWLMVLKYGLIGVSYLLVLVAASFLYMFLMEAFVAMWMLFQ